MSRQKQSPDKEAMRKLRDELYDAIDSGAVTVAEAVRRMRKLSGLTQTEFASHRGVSARVIKEIERGTANPTVNTLNQIGHIFGLEVGFVRTDKRVMEKSESSDRQMLEQIVAALLETQAKKRDKFSYLHDAVKSLHFEPHFFSTKAKAEPSPPYTAYYHFQPTFLPLKKTEPQPDDDEIKKISRLLELLDESGKLPEVLDTIRNKPSGGHK